MPHPTWNRSPTAGTRLLSTHPRCSIAPAPRAERAVRAPGGGATMSRRDQPGVEIHLDEVSRRIIEQLQQDGRRSYAAIAKVVGLSEAAVRQRVQKLLDAGVMEIVAVTEVDYVVLCAGSFDLLVELVCEDDEDLFRLINDRVRTIPGVRATESFVYLRLVKQTYTWGTT